MDALLSILPQHLVSRKFYVAFTTKNDGWDLQNLYYKTEDLKPLLILIKSFKGPIIVGYFSDNFISPPTSKYCGDRDCFVARLDSSETTVCRAEEIRDGVDVAPYFVCARTYVAFGYSSTSFTNALRIEESLSTCYIGPSDTYKDSSSLILSDEGSSFDIEEIEIIHFPL